MLLSTQKLAMESWYDCCVHLWEVIPRVDLRDQGFVWEGKSATTDHVWKWEGHQTEVPANCYEASTETIIKRGSEYKARLAVMTNWQQNNVLFMTRSNAITLTEWMKGPLLTTVYRCAMSISVCQKKKKSKPASFLSQDLFKRQGHVQILPVWGCTCRQSLLSEKVLSTLLLSPRAKHGYETQSGCDAHQCWREKGLWRTDRPVLHFDHRGRTQVLVSQNSATSTEMLFILTGGSEVHF